MILGRRFINVWTTKVRTEFWKNRQETTCSDVGVLCPSVHLNDAQVDYMSHSIEVITSIYKYYSYW